MKNDKIRDQIIEASVYGTSAHKRGLPGAPVRDARVMKMLEGRSLDITPEGEASTVSILSAWNTAWSIATDLAGGRWGVKS